MEPGATIEVHIVWRKKEQTKVALDFIAFTRKVLSSLPPVIDMTHDLERILREVSPKQRSGEKCKDPDDPPDSRNRASCSGR